MDTEIQPLDIASFWVTYQEERHPLADFCLEMAERAGLHNLIKGWGDDIFAPAWTDCLESGRSSDQR